MTVSRETLEKLECYQALLLKWQRSINLVASSTLNDLWERHFVDSMQVYDYVSRETIGPYVDVGSGAGFPGMILAMMGLYPVTLVESDHRKIEFLRAVRLATQTQVHLAAERIENHQGSYGAITARGFSSIETLLSMTYHLAVPTTRWLLWKGSRWQEEINDASVNWSFHFDLIQSITSKDSYILDLRDIKRRSS